VIKYPSHFFLDNSFLQMIK